MAGKNKRELIIREAVNMNESGRKERRKADSGEDVAFGGNGMEENEVRLEMTACPQNERFARLAAAGFILDLDPTLVEMEDVKTAVSEAVTNAIIHGYGLFLGETEKEQGKAAQPAGKEKVLMVLRKKEKELTVIIEDYGKGMEDVEKAMEPMYTTRPEWERSGMGFAFMEAFMDSLSVESRPGLGTRVVMKKRIYSEDREEDF